MAFLVDIEGQFAVENVVVEENGELRFLTGSNIVRRHNDSFRSVSNPGEYFFTSLILKRGSKFSTEGGTIITGGLFNVKINVRVESDFFDIETDECILEEGAILDVSMQDSFLVICIRSEYFLFSSFIRILEKSENLYQLL